MVTSAVLDGIIHHTRGQGCRVARPEDGWVSGSGKNNTRRREGEGSSYTASPKAESWSSHWFKNWISRGRCWKQQDGLTTSSTSTREDNPSPGPGSVAGLPGPEPLRLGVRCAGLVASCSGACGPALPVLPGLPGFCCCGLLGAGASGAGDGAVVGLAAFSAIKEH